jgi:hypothetical protein
MKMTSDFPTPDKADKLNNLDQPRPFLLSNLLRYLKLIAT